MVENRLWQSAAGSEVGIDFYGGTLPERLRAVALWLEEHPREAGLCLGELHLPNETLCIVERFPCVGLRWSAKRSA